MRNSLTSFDSVPEFKPRQILCLEHQEHLLYSEVIQVVQSRQLCWVRPLMLVAIANCLEVKKLVDLRMTSDLFWPTSLFRPALDTEVIPLLMQLESPEFPSVDIQDSRQQLHHFIHQIWQRKASGDRQLFV